MGKLKQNMEMSDENDIKQQVWKLYAHVFNCKNRDVIMKYPMDALTQIRKKMDEQKYVINLAFSTIQKLKTSDSE